MSAIRTMLRRLVDAGGECDRKDFDELGIGYSVSSRVAEMQAVGWVKVRRVVTITEAGRRELDRISLRQKKQATVRGHQRSTRKESANG